MTSASASQVHQELASSLYYITYKTFSRITLAELALQDKHKCMSCYSLSGMSKLTCPGGKGIQSVVKNLDEPRQLYTFCQYKESKLWKLRYDYICFMVFL